MSRPLLVLLAVSFLFYGACGKKGPPFIPQKSFPLRVEALKGVSDSGRILLTGSVPGARAGSIDISGYTVYHVRYPLHAPPCEGCPVRLTKLKTVRGEVVSGDRFSCEIPEMNDPGIHFFSVRLRGVEEIEGPPSERIKLVITDD